MLPISTHTQRLLPTNINAGCMEFILNEKLVSPLCVIRVSWAVGPSRLSKTRNLEQEKAVFELPLCMIVDILALL